jgi:hypothetical protein
MVALAAGCVVQEVPARVRRANVDHGPARRTTSDAEVREHSTALLGSLRVRPVRFVDDSDVRRLCTLQQLSALRVTNALGQDACASGGALDSGRYEVRRTGDARGVWIRVLRNAVSLELGQFGARGESMIALVGTGDPSEVMVLSDAGEIVARAALPHEMLPNVLVSGTDVNDNGVAEVIVGGGVDSPIWVRVEPDRGSLRVSRIEGVPRPRRFAWRFGDSVLFDGARCDQNWSYHWLSLDQTPIGQCAGHDESSLSLLPEEARSQATLWARPQGSWVAITGPFDGPRSGIAHEGAVYVARVSNRGVIEGATKLDLQQRGDPRTIDRVCGDSIAVWPVSPTSNRLAVGCISPPGIGTPVRFFRADANGDVSFEGEVRADRRILVPIVAAPLRQSSRSDRLSAVVVSRAEIWVGPQGAVEPLGNLTIWLVEQGRPARRLWADSILPDAKIAVMTRNVDGDDDGRLLLLRTYDREGSRDPRLESFRMVGPPDAPRLEREWQRVIPLDGVRVAGMHSYD